MEQSEPLRKIFRRGDQIANMVQKAQDLMIPYRLVIALSVVILLRKTIGGCSDVQNVCVDIADCRRGKKVP